MTREENIRAILECNFSESKEELIDIAVKNIMALSQEPNRDIKEIAEIMKSDADAETKCKMISNILTAKPHYFELSQEPCDECLYNHTSICGNCKDYDEFEEEPTEFEEINYVQEHKKIPVTLDLTPCDDAIRRIKMDRTVVWIVTYWNNTEEPTVTVWGVKKEAEEHLKYCKEHYENAILDEAPIFTKFSA